MLCYAKPRTDIRRIQSIIAKVTFHFTLKGIFLEKWEMFPDDVVLRSSDDSVSKNKNHVLHVKAHNVLTMFWVVAKTYSSTYQENEQENENNPLSKQAEWISTMYLEWIVKYSRHR